MFVVFCPMLFLPTLSTPSLQQLPIKTNHNFQIMEILLLFLHSIPLVIPLLLHSILITFILLAISSKTKQGNRQYFHFENHTWLSTSLKQEGYIHCELSSGSSGPPRQTTCAFRLADPDSVQCVRCLKGSNRLAPVYSPPKCWLDILRWSCDVSAVLHRRSWPNHARSHPKSEGVLEKNLYCSLSKIPPHYRGLVMCTEGSCMYDEVSSLQGLKHCDLQIKCKW